MATSRQLTPWESIGTGGGAPTTFSRLQQAGVPRPPQPPTPPPQVGGGYPAPSGVSQNLMDLLIKGRNGGYSAPSQGGFVPDYRDTPEWQAQNPGGFHTMQYRPMTPEQWAAYQQRNPTHYPGTSPGYVRHSPNMNLGSLFGGGPNIDPAPFPGGGGIGVPPGQGGGPIVQPRPPQAQGGGSIEQQLMDWFGNPSAYNAPQALETYNRLNTQLSQGYDIQRQRLGEEMARRGIDASTIHGGRLSDLGSEQARAQADLAGTIATDQARTLASDRSQALAALLGYGQQGFENQLAQSQLGHQFDMDEFQMILALLGMT